jgi:hypothetical protein
MGAIIMHVLCCCMRRRRLLPHLEVTSAVCTLVGPADINPTDHAPTGRQPTLVHRLVTISSTEQHGLSPQSKQQPCCYALQRVVLPLLVAGTQD